MSRKRALEPTSNGSAAEYRIVVGIDDGSKVDHFHLSSSLVLVMGVGSSA